MLWWSCGFRRRCGSEIHTGRQDVREEVERYVLAADCFTGLAAYSVICLGSSKVVILWENGVPDEWQEGVLDVSVFRF